VRRRNRLRSLQLEFQQAATDFFCRKDVSRAMEVLSKVGRPDGHLDIREHLA